MDTKFVSDMRARLAASDRGRDQIAAATWDNSCCADQCERAERPARRVCDSFQMSNVCPTNVSQSPKRYAAKSAATQQCTTAPALFSSRGAELLARPQRRGHPSRIQLQLWELR